MQRTWVPILFLMLIGFSCTQQDERTLAAFRVYCEMVASEAKPVALHHPMEPAEVNRLWGRFQEAAKEYGVRLYREDDFPQTLLFPTEDTRGMSVVIIYKGNRLDQYLQLRSDIIASKPDEKPVGRERIKGEALARRLGRLLGYSAMGTNRLLERNSEYRNLASFKVQEQVTHLYYENPDQARDFYAQTLGLKLLDSTRVQISADTYLQLHAFDDKHPREQPRSTAIALLTAQLPQWYAYLKEEGVEVKHPYKSRDGGPHDGFVVIDPGGYLLEFEQFKQHPENELLMAVLARADTIRTGIKDLGFFGSITWTYHKDLLAMQEYYEEVLGFEQVADQGWTKIYQTSPTGFIGLVDELRGMQDYADEKAVELEWRISDMNPFDAYAAEYWRHYEYKDSTFLGPEKYVYKVRAF